LRSLKEIATTLDAEGRTENLPFMLEMLQLAGQQLTVSARADKTCDTIKKTGCTREMTDTVHLEGLRCDGSAHGGCQASCLLFFKEAWLERIEGDEIGDEAPWVERSAAPAELTARIEAFSHRADDTYRCQATELLNATSELRGYRHYLVDLQTRNVSLGRFMHAMPWALVNFYQRRSHRLPKFLRIADGARLPRVKGKVRNGEFPEWERLDLQPGELVEVRSREEIEATLDENQRNRGLWFDEEMLRLCGRRGRVVKRVERILDERSGRMLRIKKDAVIIEGMLGCDGLYHNLCPRLMVAFMREAWLRRVHDFAGG
jgi:hypothetical protein